MTDEPLCSLFGLSPENPVNEWSYPETLVRRGGPDTIAVFAIRPVPADIGGSSPRKTTVATGCEADGDRGRTGDLAR